MKVFVIGSSRAIGQQDAVRPEKDDISAAACEIGEALATAGHTIWVGTDDDIDVDPHVVEGALKVEPPPSVLVAACDCVTISLPQASIGIFMTMVVGTR